MYKHFTENQRHTLAILLQENFTYTHIAQRLNVSVSTISREIKRNKKRKIYDYKIAQEKAEKRKQKIKQNRQRKIKPTLIKKALNLLTKKQWSPVQISGYFARLNLHISHETIYRIIRTDKRNGGTLYQHCRHRLKRRKPPVGKWTPIRDRTPISQRPPEANGTRYGDWEMDTIVGKNNKGAILTLVERSTNYCFIRKLPNGKNATELAKIVAKVLYPYRRHVHTITTDNGVEFAKHQLIAYRLQTKIYFTDPYSSWQKGNIEHINKLIRQYIPKQTDFEWLDDVFLRRIETKLNARPRKKYTFLHQNLFF